MTDTSAETGTGIDDITLDTVLGRRPSPDVEWVEVDGEIVVWEREGEALHLLDQIASLIFQLCDGVTPLGVTVDELAEAFGRDPVSVGPDVLRCSRSLAEMRLVEAAR